MIKLINKLKNKKGATAIEYGLIAALISIIIIAGLQLTGRQLSNTYNDIGNTIQNANDEGAAARQN